MFASKFSKLFASVLVALVAVFAMLAFAREKVKELVKRGADVIKFSATVAVSGGLHGVVQDYA